MNNDFLGAFGCRKAYEALIWLVDFDQRSGDGLEFDWNHLLVHRVIFELRWTPLEGVKPPVVLLVLSCRFVLSDFSFFEEVEHFFGFRAFHISCVD